MANDGSGLGGGTVSRLTNRLERKELSRQSMGDGGTIYRGALASRALNALGARAMTLDRSIIVDDGFDPSKAEDRALYAHEQYHAEQGDGQGGGGNSNFRDAEEVAARAVERQALYRAMEGGYEGGYQPGAGAGAAGPGQGADQGGHGVNSGTQSADEKNETVQSKPSPERGYLQLIEEGYSHDDVVDELARKVVSAMDERQQVQFDRHFDKKGTF